MAFELPSPQTANARDFVVQFLGRLGRPGTTSEIRTGLRDGGFKIKDASLNWALTNLNTAGRIRRVSRGVYSAVAQRSLALRISGSNDLKDWLAGKPNAWAQLILFRAALRCLPLATDVFDLPGVSPSEGWL